MFSWANENEENIDKALERITFEQNLPSFLFNVLILIMAK